MNISDIQALSQLIQPEEDESSYPSLNNNPNKGSIFAPSDIGSTGQKKEIAKPYAPIQVKVGQKEQQTQPQQEQQKQEKQKIANKNDIWDLDEISVQNRPKADNRKRPDVEIMYKQTVGTEDVFGGWSGIDPSSTKCQALLIKIKLPGTRLAEINLEVLKQQILLSSTQYYLDFVLPYPINEKAGKAKFITDKETLEIDLPIIREELY